MEYLNAWLAQAEEHRRKTKRPLVSLAYAQSLDGSLTVRRGQPTPLSGPESYRFTHRLRAAHDAILVGVGTVLSDNPLLTVRLADGPDPQPVILDSQLRTPSEANLLRRHPLPAWIATTRAADSSRRVDLEAVGARLLLMPADSAGRVSLPDLLEYLAEQGISSLMVEGGASVISSFLAEGLIDLVIITIAPVFIGGLRAVTQDSILSTADMTVCDYPRLRQFGYERLGDDLVIYGRMS